MIHDIVLGLAAPACVAVGCAVEIWLSIHHDNNPEEGTTDE